MGKSKCQNIDSCSYIVQLKDQINKLETENVLLRKEVGQLRGKYFGRKQKKKAEKQEQERKKRGAPVGHAGWYRQVPKEADEIIDVYPEECPLCGGNNLSATDKIEEHTQEDIVFPTVKVSRYVHHWAYCIDCKQVVKCPHGKDELPASYIGPVAKAVSVYLKYKIKMSDRDIQELFEKLFQLRINTSSIIGFRNQLRRKGVDIYEHLKGQIKKASYVNIDETGWREDGENMWLWNASNNKICINHIDRSRGQKVAKELLGEDYGGIVVSDFLSAYNIFKTNQRCIVHFQREIKKVNEGFSEDESVQRYCLYLMKLFDKAITLKDDYYQEKILSFNEYIKKCKKIENDIVDFEFVDRGNRPLVKLAERIKKYKKELFTFLYHEKVPYHNNHAEQQIRPNVLLRKITFGNRSGKGVLNHNVLMSILQTGKLNKCNLLELMKSILVSTNKEEILSFLLPP